ncbi:ribosome recycling factor [Rostrohypoxylon terebratum]|nr:ribosome recycling factor [Rostrohypoxylon terebratum]
MRNSAVRAILRRSIARHELTKGQHVTLRPVNSQIFSPPQQQCPHQLCGASPPSAFVKSRSFYTTTQWCRSKPRKDTGSFLTAAAGPAEVPGRHPAPNPEEPLDFADVQSRIAWQSEHFESILKKLRAGGRFNPDMIGTLRIQPDRKDSTTYPLKEVASIIPRGGRTISLLAHEEAYIKPIMSAVQASPDFNQQPQRVPDNDLELLLKIEPETKDDLLKRTRGMFTEWRDRLRAIRHKRDKQHTAWYKDRTIGPDLKRSVDKELEKVIKNAMARIDTLEKEAMKSLESS